jgi:GNAT superfamily N-acetyltransferase
MDTKTYRAGGRGFENAAAAVRRAVREGACHGRTRSQTLGGEFVTDTALRMSDVLVLGPRGGFAAVMTNPYAKEWYVAALCGKGDGAKVMDRVRTAARRAGAARVTLSPTPSAKPFYRKLGFVEATGKKTGPWSRPASGVN